MKCENCQRDKKDHVKLENQYICPTALYTRPVGNEEEKEPVIEFPSSELATALHRSSVVGSKARITESGDIEIRFDNGMEVKI